MTQLEAVYFDYEVLYLCIYDMSIDFIRLDLIMMNIYPMFSCLFIEIEISVSILQCDFENIKTDTIFQIPL